MLVRSPLRTFLQICATPFALKETDSGEEVRQ
jgi:hypothetical protein